MLFLHQEECAFNKALPVLNELLINVEVVSTGYHVVCLIKIFLTYANLEYFLHSLRYKGLVVVQLHSLIEVQQCLRNIVLLEIYHSLVVQSFTAGAISLKVSREVTQS